MTCNLLLLGFTFGVAPAQAGTPLADAWQGVLATRPESRAVAVRVEQGLAHYWRDLVAGYPLAAMQRPLRTLAQAERIPDAYKRVYRGKRNSKALAARLRPFEPWIGEAARRFEVPEAIIRAVILQESGADPRARASGSSAKGLMQTIDATFALARRNLARQGMSIGDPFNPRDAIFAGTWYLAHCFEQAGADQPITGARSDARSWRRPLEYYYAGPGWGRDPRPILHLYIDGNRVRIDKASYSSGVLAYVRMLEGRGG